MKAWQTFAGALVAAATVAVVVVATGTAMRGGSSATQTFTLFESADVGSFTYLDNEPKSSRSQNSDQGPVVSQGDSFTFTSELLNKSKKHAGWLHATCTATFAGEDFGKARFTCSGLFDLRGGTMIVNGLLDPRKRMSHIAITGGTGAYEGAIGQIDVENHDDAPNVDTVRFRRV
jgi:hypothetical protein